MNTKPVILYKQDNNGKVRQWSIMVVNSVIQIEYGEYNGSMQYQEEKIEEGKAGRTIKEQIMSRVASRINNRRKQGYVNNYEEAKENRPTNLLDLPLPMLAQKYKGVMPDQCAIQFKYDGNRCLITKQNGEVFAYSRQGKRINSIDHILKAASHIAEGTILDGELYHHGTPLQTIRSWISRAQAESNDLVYMCYDIMLPISYLRRFEILKKIGFQRPIFVAPTDYVTDLTNITAKFQMARKLGYEGLILRDMQSRYEDGKRSRGLLKMKAWESSEYMVLDIVPSKDGWAILVCECDGKLFRVSCHGTIEYKTEVLMNAHEYLGRHVTVEYANLTKDKLPFHPVAIAWRNEDDL